ncbi:LacI family DNA-binding transcriptional regulator [Paenibacillus sp.]|uniref:LacI family DNA-binding transcriptional regulator n=1 Tax=Paenibacillus sp. TaxID=58172 RepID=UPI002D2280BC|nr:LacI family DNA-binding transcriptional regulator [Paenibacillus sp.]HZG87874.1 LacI family DNA-binding transcriptional regulator [Paenibacillus sp.]
MSGHTLESIAKLAGVSRGTVSRIVNDQPGVKPEVRRRVLDIIHETGYVPNAQARSLAGGKTNNVGVVVFGEDPLFLHHHIFYEVLQGVQKRATAHGYDLLLFANRADADKEYWKRIADRRKVDGLVIMGERIEESYLAYYAEYGMPFALVGKRNFPRVAYRCVTSDYRQGAYDAVRHLLECGRSRIVLIQGRPDTYHEAEKRAGYERALMERGIPVDETLVLRGDADAESAKREIRRLLESGAAFDAVFAGNDWMAIGAVQALRQDGRTVPGDVAVVGYDDMPGAAYFDPPLTTVSQNKLALGEEAVELLLRVMNGESPEPEEDVIVGNALIVRDST